MSRADDLRETIAGLEQAASHIGSAVRKLFDLHPELNEDLSAEEEEMRVPDEALAMRSALSEAGSYLGDAIAELERFAREEDDRPDLDEAIEEIADAIVGVTKARVASLADHYDLVTETVFDGSAADRIRRELLALDPRNAKR